MPTIIRSIVNTFQVTPVLDDSAAYSSGDQLTEAFEIEDIYTQGWGDQCILQSIQVLDKAKQDAEYDFLFFGTEPTLTSTANDPIDISDTEIDKLVGSVSVRSCGASDSYIDLAGSSVLTMTGINLEMTRSRTSSGDQVHSPSIYCVAVVRTGSVSYATDSLRFTFGFKLL